jgi:hypothetical protein
MAVGWTIVIRFQGGAHIFLCTIAAIWFWVYSTSYPVEIFSQGISKLTIPSQIFGDSTQNEKCPRIMFHFFFLSYSIFLIIFSRMETFLNFVSEFPVEEMATLASPAHGAVTQRCMKYTKT